MPYIKHSTYQAQGIFKNAHINTLYAAVGRKVRGVSFERERLPTPDGDFFDLDWLRSGSEHLLIVLHGLEGNSGRPYVQGLARFFHKQHWDVAALNFRSCSGELNHLPRLYHMGETGDLRQTVHHALATGKYRYIALAGFSLGGNVVLKYLGEDPAAVPHEVKAATTFSVPCHIASANEEIDKWKNRLYRWKFMQTLNEKMRHKSERWPEMLKMPTVLPTRFCEFDNCFTAPLHGFADAHDYWSSSGAIRFIPHIQIPTLLVNALDDTFLSAACYPVETAANHPHFHLETPVNGGHVGFVSAGKGGIYWSERRAWQFVSQHLHSIPKESAAGNKRTLGLV